MKKALTLLGVTAALAVGTSASAQVVWEDNFDSYETGSAIDGQGGWEPWAGTSLVSTVSDTQALSAPNSVQITGADDLVRQYTGYTTGVYAYTVWQYVPGEGAGTVSFILLNNYPATANPDWSVATNMDPSTGLVTAWGGETLPLLTDQWVEIRVVINLDADRQEIFYGGELLVAKSWTGGVADGGQLNIAAVDLFGNSVGYLHYYDNLSLEQLPPWGACCFESGECMQDDPIDVLACEDLGGIFQGIGSSCVASFCPTLGDGGWVLDFSDLALRNQSASSGGFEWGASTGHADTTTEGNDCDLSSSNDIAWEVTVPETAEYIFSVCDASFDTVLALGSAPCTDDIASSDDAAGCGTASEIRITLEAGTYYLTLEGFGGGSAGPFTLRIYELCPELPAPGGKTYIEAEACGDDTNGGCNMAVPAYEPLLCDSTNRGTAWTDGAARDTDWWELIVTSTTSITMTGISERASTVFGIINSGGSGDCVDATAVSPAVAIAPCFQDEPAVVTASLDPGTWWFFVATEFGSPVAIDCGDLDTYEFTLVCGDSCVPSPDGDVTGDGFTDFSDLLDVLAQWGTAGSADADCDGDVGFTDLLAVLSNWNPPS